MTHRFAGRSRNGHTDGELLEREHDPFDELQREIDRSRRHGHRFVLVRFAPASSDLRDLTRSLTASLRRTDRWWLEGGDVVVLAPESTPARVGPLVARLRGTIDGITSVAAVAFPDDGLTARALLAALRHGEPRTFTVRAQASADDLAPSTNGHGPGRRSLGSR